MADQGGSGPAAAAVSTRARKTPQPDVPEPFPADFPVPQLPPGQIPTYLCRKKLVTGDIQSLALTANSITLFRGLAPHIQKVLQEEGALCTIQIPGRSFRCRMRWEEDGRGPIKFKITGAPDGGGWNVIVAAANFTLDTLIDCWVYTTGLTVGDFVFALKRV